MVNVIKNINIPELKDKFNQKKSQFSISDIAQKIKNLDLKKIEQILRNSDRPIIFVHSDTDLNGVNEKSNLILSPAYYWCKRESLEINSLRKAGKLTQSIFFGQLPDGNFHYKATKIGGEFFFFAYDKDKILEDLLAQGIKKEHIGNVYFAQNECTADKVCKISERFALIHQDTMVSIMPLQYAKDPKDFDTLNLTLSNTYFKYRNTVAGSDKNLIIPAGFIAVWIILEMVQGSRLSDEVSRLESRQTALVKKYKLPETTFQRNAIKDKFSSIEKSQNKIRQILTDITSFQTSKEGYFESISFDKKEIKAVFVYTNETMATQLKSSLKGADITQQDKKITVSYKL